MGEISGWSNNLRAVVGALAPLLYGHYFVCRASLPGLEFLFLGLVWVWCAFCVRPVLGHNSDVPELEQAHTKPTPSPHQTHTTTYSMRTPNPHQTQTKPRRNPDRAQTEPTPNQHQSHTKPTPNPHHGRQHAHIKPKANPHQTQKCWQACAAHEGIPTTFSVPRRLAPQMCKK